MSNYTEMWNELLWIMKQREKQMEEDKERQRDDMKKILRQFECGVDPNTGLPYLRRKTLGFFKKGVVLNPYLNYNNGVIKISES